VKVAILFLAVVLAWPIMINAIVYLDRRRVLRDVCEGNDPLHWRTAVSAFLTECAALYMSFGARVFVALGRRRVPCPDGNHLVIFVAGDGLHESSFWVLERQLRLLGWRTAAMHAGAWRGDPARAAEKVGRRLLQIRDEFAAPTISVVAFGCSGLWVRRWLHGQSASGIRQLVTLGTPHRGTLGLLSRFGRFRFLRPSSSFLRDLADQDPVPRRVDTIAIYSELDAWVVPNDAAYYPGAFNIAVRDVGHFSLLFSKRIAGLVAENLKAPVQRV
jgi:hypothetical protein